MEKEKAYPIKIGLEVHGYLDTREKLFCMCKTDSLDSDNNSRICPICTGQPGSKPMAANGEAIRKVLQIATIFGSRINTSGLIWQRKHYNWADNPKGYQTTISGAHATTNATGGKFSGINITELHLEEDPAQWNPETGRIDYNRSGLPLIEMVTEPEFLDSEQVVEWLKNLVLALSYIGALRKNAGIKVDVNVSTYGERVEMKNLNSLEKIRRAINYEIARQIEAHDAGEVQKRETLAFDEKLGKTIKMRSKEDAADYRFIPDPDLPEIVVSKKMIADVKASLPEMPEEKLSKLLKKFKVGEADAKILTKNLELVEFFEELSKTGDGKIGNVVLVHGSPRVDRTKDKDYVMDSKKAWIGWTKKELDKRKIKCVCPQMPTPWKPKYSEWKKEFEKIAIDENSVLVGTSAGGAFLVRWLADTKKKIKKLILVSPGKVGKTDKLGEFYGNKSYDIKNLVKEKIVVYTSKDDSPNHIEGAKEYAEEFDAKLFIFGKGYGHFTSTTLVSQDFPELLDEILSAGGSSIDIKQSVPWITVELLRVLNYNKKTLEDDDVDVKPEHLAELIKAVDSGKITKLKGKQIMNEFIPKSFSLAEHKDEISSIDDAAIENLCRQVIDENAHVVDEYKSGKDASLNYLIGQVMRLSERRADFKVAGDKLKELIGSGSDES